MEAPRLSRAPSSASSAPSPSTSSSVAARSAACLPCPAHSGHLPAVRAETEALRRLNPPHRAARPRDFTARARAASSAKCNPAGEEGIASTSQLGEFQRGGASREAAGALPAGARARSRPHVSLRLWGMWVTEASGLTCPRPPPPPQRPLCNAASRARPANRRPRAAERKHSAHVARAARPCEGGARPAPPARAAALQGAVRATVGRPGGGRQEPSLGRIRSAQHPTPRAWGHLRPPPPDVPQRAPSVPPPARPATVLLPAFTSMVPSGRGPRPTASRSGGSSASASAPRRPWLGAAVVAGPPHGRGRARRPGPAAGELAAERGGAGGGGWRAALLAGSLTTKAAARRLPAASAPRQRGRLTGRAAATM